MTTALPRGTLGAAMLRIGTYEIHSVQTGSLALDGGAMFGVVPKVMWSKSSDCDEFNRIPLATRTLLAVDRSHECVLIADTGCGSKWPPKEAERYAIRYDPNAIDKKLTSLGLSREAVTDVVVTHLHFDHNGGLTDWRDKPGGDTILRYPQARHWIHRRHWQHAQQPHPKDKPSFLPEDFAALGESGVLHFVDGDGPDGPFEGLGWYVSHGHTPYHLHPFFHAGDQRLLFVGDLIPTIPHLRPAWVMAYDVQPMTTIDEKRRLLEQAIRERWTLAFAHDPRHSDVRVDGTVNRPIVAEASAL